MASRCLSSSEKYIIALLLWQSYLAVIGEIIVSPKDTEASIGETIALLCTSTTDAIEWHHVRAGSDIPEIVYKDGYIFNGFNGRFYANNCSSAVGECRLVIQNVGLNDAGTYTCMEISEESVRKTAQLTVYEQYPSTEFCVTRITCSSECNTLELSCNMMYNGNLDAFMEWRDSAGELMPSDSITISGITTSTVRLNRDHSQSTLYTCRVTYPTTSLGSRYSWTHKPQDFLASSTPQHEENQQMTALITIFVIVVAVLFGIIFGLIGYIGHRMHKRKRKRCKSCNTGVVENGPRQSGDDVQELTEQQTPLMSNDIELDESWTEGEMAEMAPRTIANKNQAIHGFSVIDDEVFLVTREGCIVEVFNLNTFKFVRAWRVDGLFNPSDMVSCPRRKRLYICDRKKSAEEGEIVCIDIQGNVEVKWISEHKGRLSISKESHVIVAESWYNTIKEYSSHGQLKNKFQTGRDKLHLWHAIKLSDGYFVASFGDSQDVFQDVCVFDKQGEEIHSFANILDLSSNHSMAVPRALAVDGDGNIYVADLYNERIIILTSELQWKGELDVTKTGARLRGPLRICLHEFNDKRQLLIADSRKENAQWKDGKILVFDIEK